MQKNFFLFLPLCTGPEEENGVQIFDEESCGVPQDMSSPDEEDEHPLATSPPLSTSHPLSTSRGCTGKFSNVEATV